MRHPAASLLLILSAATLAAQQRGLQPGAEVPAIRLADQSGTVRDLKSLSGVNGTVLVFYRSADW